MKMIQSLTSGNYPPDNRAQYGGSELGRILQQVARLIKADAGVEAAFAEIGSWDHHPNEPTIPSRAAVRHRAALSELVSGRLGQKEIAQAFPGYKPGEELGLLRS